MHNTGVVPFSFEKKNKDKKYLKLMQYSQSYGEYPLTHEPEQELISV